jgi:hypothetical protein
MASPQRMLTALVKRRDYLGELIKDKRTHGSQHTYDAGERQALSWALSILIPYVDRELARRSRNQLPPVISRWSGDPPPGWVRTARLNAPVRAAERPLDASDGSRVAPGGPEPPQIADSDDNA